MKKKFVFVLVTIFAITLALFLCSCVDTPKDDTGGGTDKPITDKDGWEKISSIENKDMYTKFLLGFTNVAYELSEDRVNAKGAVTIDGSAAFSLNDNNFYLSAKGKYDSSDSSKIRERAILAVELSTSETFAKEGRLVFASIYNDELYLAIGENKVRFDISRSRWTDYYPYEMKEQNSQDLSNIAGMLASYVKLNENPVGYTRRNSNKEEFKYSININLKQTLTELCKGMGTITKDEKLIANVKNFIASLLGITVEQLEAGETPQSDMTLNFIVSGNQIQSVTGNASIDLSKSDSQLIEEDELNIGAEIENLKITNKYGEGVAIDFVNDTNELQSYTRYNEAVYYLSIPIKKYDDNDVAISNNYDLNVTTRVFQEDSQENFIFFEYRNLLDDIVERALYVYNDKAYVFVKEEEQKEAECIYTLDIDLSDLATRLLTNDLNGTQKIDVYALIAYFLRNLAITETEIGFLITEDFYTNVWYNFEDMIAYIDNLDIEHNIDELPKVRAFIDYFKTNEVILTINFSDSEMLQIIKEDSKQITNVLAKLDKVEINVPDEDLSDENIDNVENTGDNFDLEENKENIE